MLDFTQYGKTIYSGKESSGKSLDMSRTAYQVLLRNARWFKHGLPVRPIWSSMKFFESFETLAKDLGVPIIYWKNLEEIVGLSGCDIFIDEIGKFFDATLWSEIPPDVRGWLAQCDKNGVNIYGTAQDFSQIALSFRRLTKHLYHYTKVVGSRRPHETYPKVRYIWGLIIKRNIDPTGYKEQDAKLDKSGFPSFFFIHRADCERFDTNQNIPNSMSLPLRHITRVCATCGLSKVQHS